MAKLSDEERKRIIALIEAGGKRNEIARDTGRSAGTVSAIAKEIDRPFDQSATKRATEARQNYALAGRLELNNELFDKLRGMVAGLTDDAGAFRDLAVSYGILTDKRRLEDGEATERKENIDPSRRERIRASLDEVAAKRRERVG